MKISIKELTKYRGFWMGLAILWAMAFHCDIPVSSKAISCFQRIGYGDVDIFLFASGLGIYCSLTRSGSEGFLPKRLKRILPAYYLVLPFWILMNYFSDGTTWSQIIGNALCVQYLVSGVCLNCTSPRSFCSTF